MERIKKEKELYAPILHKGIDAVTGKPVVRYAFTSDQMDTGGDIITKEATLKATEAWREWRNVRLQHDPSRPIGKAIAIGEQDGLDWNQMDVRIDDPSVAPLIAGDDPTLGGASVGIIVNEYEVSEDPAAVALAFWEPWIINDYTLVEISLVDHPANYDAKRVQESAVENERQRVIFMQRDMNADRSARKNSTEQEEIMPEEIKAIEESEEEKEVEVLEAEVVEIEQEVEVEVEKETEVPEEIEAAGDETPQEEVKQEEGDPVMVVLKSIEDKLDSLTVLSTESFKSMMVKDVADVVEDVEEVTEEDPLDKAVDNVEVVAEEVQETEPVTSEDQFDQLFAMFEKKFEERFEGLFEQKIEELKQLSPRISKAVPPDVAEEKPEEKEDKIDARTPYEKLRDGIKATYS